MSHFVSSSLRCACFALILIAPGARADVVQATYMITSSDFRNSNGGPPDAPTSNAIDGIYTVTFNSAIPAQMELVPDSVTGLDITDNDGVTFDYDELNSGVNTQLFSSSDKLRLTIGGTQSSVEFMVGISNDFRVVFEISDEDFSVLGVTSDLAFVTTVDAYYTAENTSVTLIDVVIDPDSDNDQLVDTVDNCIEAANLDQRDTDADGFGNRCDADFNQDCIVNFLDLGQLRLDFFLNGDLDTDLDGDGQVNVGDLGLLRTLFFAPPGPSGVAGQCVP